MGRVQKPGEPYFLEEDTEAVFEHFEEQALKCPGCGLPRDETFATDPEHALVLERSFESSAVRCYACAARDKAQSDYTKGEYNSNGLMFTVRRKGVDG